MKGNDWQVICRVEDIPVLGARRVARERSVDVAVFRNGEDQVFALLDRCPHKGGPLSQGIVFGTSVACPLHNWTIPAWTTARPGRRPGLHPALLLPGGRRQRAAGPGGAGHARDRPGAAQGGALPMKETRSCPYWRGVRRHHPQRGRAHHGRAWRPGAPGQLRAPVHQGLDAAPDRRAGGAAARALLHPMRREQRGGQPLRVDWNEALDHAADASRR